MVWKFESRKGRTAQCVHDLECESYIREWFGGKMGEILGRKRY